MLEEKKVLKVMMCDDDPADRSLVRQLLKRVPEQEYELFELPDGETLLASIQEVQPDVILLDMQLPGKSGLEWLEEINALEVAPVIMSTGHGDEMIAVNAMKAGAFDYLPKHQFSASTLNRSITNAAEKWGLTRLIKKHRKEIVLIATTDELTGIMNRRSLMEALKQRTEAALRDGTPLTAIMLDIDHFKRVNDTYGHDMGDEVIVGVTKAVSSVLDNCHAFGRYGGEEFMVVVSGKGLDDTVRIAEACRRAVEGNPLVDRDSLKIFATISVGVGVFNQGMKSHEELIKQADLALYKAKEGGRNRVEVMGLQKPSQAA